MKVKMTVLRQLDTQPLNEAPKGKRPVRSTRSDTYQR